MIGPDEAHVWILDDAPGQAADCDALCGPELEAMRKLRIPAARRAYALRHVALRHALSRCVPVVAPGEWSFDRGPCGRPEVLAGRDLPPIRFNISHTRGAMAFVVTATADCGIDIEAKNSQLDLGAMSSLVLGDSERIMMASTCEGDRLRLFYQLWTLKEAYLKACGLGLSRPMTTVEFDVRATSPALAESRPRDGRAWQFDQWSVGDEYLVALAVGAPREAPIRVVHHAALD